MRNQAFDKWAKGRQLPATVYATCKTAFEAGQAHQQTKEHNLVVALSDIDTWPEKEGSKHQVPIGFFERRACGRLVRRAQALLNAKRNYGQAAAR